MPLTAAALVTAGIGAYHAIKGVVDNNSAKLRAKYNIRPTYNIPEEYYTNRDLAASMAQGGLTDAAKNYYEQNAERGLGSGIGALLATGGGINGIQKLYSGFTQGNQALAAKDSELQNDNIRYLVNQNNTLADQNTQKWVLDKYQPYLDTAKSVAAQKAQAAQELNDGINSIGSAVSSYAQGKISQEDKVGHIPSSMDDNGNSTVSDSVSALPAASGYTPSNNSLVKPMPNYFTPTNLAAPTAYDDLNDFNAQARQMAVNNIMTKYQNSPYLADMNNYLSNNAA